MTIADSILKILRTWHRQPSAELLGRLGVSRPTLMRAITQLDAQVVSRGRARRTSYAARRALRGSLAPLTLYQVDADAQVQEAGLLEPVYPAGCAMNFSAEFPWPLDDEMQDGWFRGLPYPLADMRPQGFLGRNFAHQYGALLQLDADLGRWSEDDVLYALSTLGSDQPGNYILGDAALRRFLNEQQSGSHFLDRDQIVTAYPQLAQQSLNFGLAGSSAAGEFPKFTASRKSETGELQHVIVKFSGADGSPQEQRWADLLVAEHLALDTISAHLNIAAARSCVYQFSGRTFYQVERFDRHGEFGRSAVCSWYEINAALFGSTASWSEAADALLQRAYIQQETVRQIKLLEQFGRLIANTDMHDGNLAFRPGLTLAPAYDMLPMAYAPQRGVELVARRFQPAMPLPRERQNWLQAAGAALIFWQRVAADPRISDSFRHIADENAGQIAGLISSQTS